MEAELIGLATSFHADLPEGHDRLRERIRLLHYSRRTEEAYVGMSTTLSAVPRPPDEGFDTIVGLIQAARQRAY